MVLARRLSSSAKLVSVFGRLERLAAGERAAGADRMGGGLLHLARQRVHVGIKPHAEQEGGIDLLGLRMGGGLVEHAESAVRSCTKIGTETLYMEMVMER